MRYLRLLYVQVLIGILIGGTIGYIWPEFGAQLKPLADAFVSLIKMLIGPIIFTTVVVGIAGMVNGCEADSPTHRETGNRN